MRSFAGRTDSMLRGDVSRKDRVVRTAATGLSAFAFGVIQGKHRSRGGAVILGAVPVDLAAGAGLHLLTLLPFFRRYSGLLSAAGDGAIASFLTTTGYRVGERWDKGGSLSSGIAGLFGDSAAAPVTGGSSIADRELSALVRD